MAEDTRPDESIRPNWKSIEAVSSEEEDLLGTESVSELYVPSEPLGDAPAFESLYAPAGKKGLLEAATFLFDLPAQGVGWAAGQTADILGFPETAAQLKNPITLSDLIGKGIEGADLFGIETMTGRPSRISEGFDVTPREPQTGGERFWHDVFYVSGGGLSFPTSIGGIFGAFRGPVSKLIEDASGRGVNSVAATAALDKAKLVKGPNARAALVEAAKSYVNRYAIGLGEKPLRTLGGEQAIATAAGVGYGLPEVWGGDDGRLEVDLGEGIGKVDVMPAVKILTSMGLPIALAHTPTGLAIAGDKTKIRPLLRWIVDKGRVFGGSLVGGFTDKGQQNLAARIFAAMEAEPGFLENVFLPAVEAGQFRSPGSSPIIKILEDGTVVPEYGGLHHDTLQAMKQLGLDDTRLAALDAALKGRGNNLQARLTEETRRANILDETFDLLKSRIDPGDEAATYKIIERIGKNLDSEALDSVERAIAKARDVYVALEPALGGDQAARLAVELLDGARLASRQVRKELWSKELIGTEFVNTQSFGDWAMQQILEAGTARTRNILPGMGLLYKIAGRKRLNDNGIGETGKPLTADDLQGVKGDADNLLTPEEIAENGLFDVFGTGPNAHKTRVDDLDKFRSEIGDLARKAYRAGDEKLGRRHGLIIDFIDDELLTAKNFEDAAWYSGTPQQNLRNIEIARKYTRSAKERFGPDSEIGRILYKGQKPLPEEFLLKLIKSGPGSGARVDLFRNALNEPQQLIQGNNVTWRRDPAATLTLGDNPNVIEAELLRRFTESVPYGKVTQNSVDRFLRQYGNAVDKIEGLRGKFSQLKKLQSSVDEMTTRLTVADRDKVLAALKGGATLDDVINARRLLSENLTDRRLANTASDYLDADVNQAAIKFINEEPQLAARRADQIEALLLKDDSGAAAAGFRAALWRALRNNSRRFNEDGNVIPGIDTKKLIDTIERTRPYLKKFYDKSSMEFLDELVKGGPLQQTGTGSQFAGTPADVMGANFATMETVGAVGRTTGQKVFGALGINPLVATGMGRRIAAYTFGKIGEERILKHVEDALRDPEKAAALIRRYKELPKWEPSPAAKGVAEAVISDPTGAARGVAVTAKDRLARGAESVEKYLKGYSMEAIQRAVRFGLIPAQAESRAINLETDYQKGPPFIYEDNKIRYEIENTPASVGPQSSSRPPVAPPTMASRMPPARPPVAGSALAQARPFDRLAARPPQQFAAAGTSQPETLAGMEQLGIPLFPAFASKGGLASLKKKKNSRQMVY